MLLFGQFLSFVFYFIIIYEYIVFGVKMIVSTLL